MNKKEKLVRADSRQDSKRKNTSEPNQVVQNPTQLKFQKEQKTEKRKLPSK